MVMGLLRWGYMKKLGGNRKTWKKRWFVLTAGFEGQEAKLQYFRTQKDTEALGTIVVGEKAKIKRIAADRFEVNTPERTYFLITSTEEDCTEWVDILNYIIGERNTEGSLEDAFMMQVGLLKTFKQHFYVLDARRICYYTDEMKTEPLGAINLRDCSEVGLLGPDCFGLVVSSNVKYFFSEDQAELEDWVAVLTNAIDYNNMQKAKGAPPAPSRRMASGPAPPPPPERTTSKKDTRKRYSESDDNDIPSQPEQDPQQQEPEPAQEQEQHQDEIGQEEVAGQQLETTQLSHVSEETPSMLEREEAEPGGGGAVVPEAIEKRQSDVKPEGPLRPAPRLPAPPPPIPAPVIPVTPVVIPQQDEGDSDGEGEVIPEVPEIEQAPKGRVLSTVAREDIPTFEFTVQAEEAPNPSEDFGTGPGALQESEGDLTDNFIPALDLLPVQIPESIRQSIRMDQAAIAAYIKERQEEEAEAAAAEAAAAMEQEKSAEAEQVPLAQATTSATITSTIDTTTANNQGATESQRSIPPPPKPNSKPTPPVKPPRSLPTLAVSSIRMISSDQPQAPKINIASKPQLSFSGKQAAPTTAPRPPIPTKPKPVLPEQPALTVPKISLTTMPPPPRPRVSSQTTAPVTSVTTNETTPAVTQAEPAPSSPVVATPPASQATTAGQLPGTPPKPMIAPKPKGSHRQPPASE